MFGIGLPEMILILALALIVVGPDKLPDLARSVAKGVLELKKTVSGLKEDLEKDNPFDSVKPEIEEVSRSIEEKLRSPEIDNWKGDVPDEGVNPAPTPDEDDEIIEAETLDQSDEPDAVSDAGQVATSEEVAQETGNEEQNPTISDTGEDRPPASIS